uniref:Uncharacterized protein n=1 Tax=Denticeps clupeoides TaxID=299321 RepID=A0AAY4DNY1_9TELE
MDCLLHSTLPFHLISSAVKLTMVGMKFSRIMMERICFQSVVLSPRSRQMDSRASLTAAGGLAMDRTSTKCCFLMDLTATSSQQDIVFSSKTWVKITCKSSNLNIMFVLSDI